MGRNLSWDMQAVREIQFVNKITHLKGFTLSKLLKFKDIMIVIFASILRFDPHQNAFNKVIVIVIFTPIIIRFSQEGGKYPIKLGVKSPRQPLFDVAVHKSENIDRGLKRFSFGKNCKCLLNLLQERGFTLKEWWRINPIIAWNWFSGIGAESRNEDKRGKR